MPWLSGYDESIGNGLRRGFLSIGRKLNYGLNKVKKVYEEQAFFFLLSQGGGNGSRRSGLGPIFDVIERLKKKKEAKKCKLAFSLKASHIGASSSKQLKIG